MIDTHCHLNLSPLSDDLEGVWNRAQEAGVTNTIVIGTTIPTSEEAVAIASKLVGIFAAVGIHPDVIGPATPKEAISLETWERELTTLAKDDRVVAIGECGLDYVDLHSVNETEAIRLKNLQKQLFGLQIKLAKKLNLPLSIHCRNVRSIKDTPHHHLNAYADLFDTLEHFSKDDGRLPKFVLHCMSGDRDYLKQGLRLGGYISFAGNVTYPSASSLVELLKATPLDRLLLETDAPFLSPQSSRGTPNEPAKVAETYEFVAGQLGMERDGLNQLTHANAKKLFLRV